MSKTQYTDVRRVVWLLLSSKEEFPSRALDAALDEVDCHPRDRGLAKEILSGSLRARATLDRIAQAYATRRIKEEPLLIALSIGLYQLLYLDRVPIHAAIDSTMNAVKPELATKSGFLNAVLRAVSRKAKPAKLGLAPAPDRLPEPAWQFDRKVFGDPVNDPIGYLSETRGYPKFLLKRWWETVGEEATRKRAEVLNQKAALWLRVNRLRCNAAEVQATLEAAGIEIEAGSVSGMLRIVSHSDAGPLPTWPGFEEGHWSVQDMTSFQSVALAKPKACERILDLCAAPGGKCFAAYEISGGKAEILACDISATRLATLEKEAERLGHKIKTLVLDPAGGNLPAGPWDLVLCDVPCSNSGVLNKRPEARGRFSKVDLHKVVTLQNVLRKRLILPVLEEQTRILWSTCSLEIEENQESAARLAKASDRAVVAEQTFEPTTTSAGGYAALVEKQP